MLKVHCILEHFYQNYLFRMCSFRSRKRKKEKKEKPPKPVNTMGSDSGAESDVLSDSDLEDKYEKELSERPVKKMRPLLPIKTKEGLMERAEECEGKHIIIIDTIIFKFFVLSGLTSLVNSQKKILTHHRSQEPRGY